MAAFRHQQGLPAGVGVTFSLHPWYVGVCVCVGFGCGVCLCVYEIEKKIQESVCVHVYAHVLVCVYMCIYVCVCVLFHTLQTQESTYK